MITPQQQKQLKSVFQKSKVEFAYIFGSHAGKYAVTDSDIDIAVFLPPRLKKKEYFDLRLKLIGQLSKIFKKDIDLTVLNTVSSLFFQHTVIAEGKLIYQKYAGASADFENRLMGLYFDFQPFLEMYNKHYVQTNIQ